MCQLECVFHHPCAHWASRSRFVGEPCVRARLVPIYAPTSSSSSSSPTLTNDDTTSDSLTTAIPCDYPDHLGAVTVQTECAECARRRRREAEEGGTVTRSLSQSSSDIDSDLEGGLNGGTGAGDTMTMTTTTTTTSPPSSVASWSSSSSSSAGAWRPFAGLSDGAWEALQRTKRARSRSRSGSLVRRGSPSSAVLSSTVREEEVVAGGPVQQTALGGEDVD